MDLRWLGVSGVVAAAASGQVIMTPGISASIDLTWQEDPSYAHNGNGLLEPGEHALILMSLSITGQYAFAAVPNFETFPGGTVLGLGVAYVDIRGQSGDASGQYNNGLTVPASSSPGPDADPSGNSGYGVRGGWRWPNDSANGHPVANGFANVQPGQLPAFPTSANQMNPIQSLDRLGWAPASYAARTQTFTVMPAAGSNNYAVELYLDLDGGTTGGGAFLLPSQVALGSVNIPIVPAPSSIMLMGVGAAALGRRARR